MLCVYALLGDAPPEPGELHYIPCGKLWAAVADIDAPPVVEEANLRAYERTVRDLSGRVDAILPARFGSVVADAPELARLLAPREAGLLAALDLVRGREQMTVRVFGEALATTPTDAGPGTRYLQAKAQPIPGLDSVGPFVKAEHIERKNTPPLLATVYHLIERGRAAEYRAALASPLRITVSGPWPPYAFSRWNV